MRSCELPFAYQQCHTACRRFSPMTTETLSLVAQAGDTLATPSLINAPALICKEIDILPTVHSNSNLMESLSGVASGIAVASLAIQLLQSVNTIRSLLHNVQDPPQELIRIADLLKRLGALLQDVRSIVEKQTSLQGHHFPVPTMTISTCLKSCEEALKPLEPITKTLSLDHNASKFAKLRSDIRLGFKTNDIKNTEIRLQHEITSLSTALAINNTNIQLQVLPAPLRCQSPANARCVQKASVTSVA
ncbi:hypothetical protein BU25DRAFT_115911 [Macroventuria anomochaeta]|uniref:Uncharacterized protein n=1 Tax=Macroventuria anomochaeta TaxID=301207 RepID=A0ACB6RWE1_9PLEO|nr:uncharacterized protein BU25DRAFT_115911 [Macroventuria anomochaeta]KAF2625572.1 hypothetical protein BU25DRAFT_115911 [Macroventuria anomochaeta]